MTTSAEISASAGGEGPVPSWQGFTGGVWMDAINVRDFIQANYQPYDGDERFLAPATTRTRELWGRLEALFVGERRKGVLDVSPVPSSITAHAPGYIDREREIIVGLQTDAPLKRAIRPNGGVRLVVDASNAYTAEMRRCLNSHLLTGLPDAYGPGRIIGDYRRIALYGVRRLIERKREEKNALDPLPSTDEIIRDREELSEQIRALEELQVMARSYGVDISGPASSAKEAVQWLYFGYLASARDQNDAALSWGRSSTFLDIYFERDLKAGVLTESQAQEIVDDFVIKLRIIRFLRPPEHDDTFTGEPVWVTESIGGLGDDGRSLVTRTSFRILQTLNNLGQAPEWNLTVWYSPRLPDSFRRYAAKVAIDTSALQFESDEIMRRTWGDDGAIACGGSALALGKQVQLFGARANLAKCLLYAINGGRDEMTGEQVAPRFPAVKGDVLQFDDVLEKFDVMMDWLAGVYVNAMNVIHYMHDKYCYERVEMALHDYHPVRTMSFGIAGMSVAADSLSAIQHASVSVVRDDTGLVTDYQTRGTFPVFGNNENRVDQLAVWLVRTLMSKLRKYPTYRNATHTQSVLTMTSNVAYGKATGHTPDGRRRGEPFAPGGRPMDGRDRLGIHAAAASMAKIPYRDAVDGISLAAALVPGALGRIPGDPVTNMRSMLDAFFSTNER